LAVYDDPENGGNDNGFIDPGDAIYSKLLLWIDENHDGISQPSELKHLSDLGVSRIDLQ
jgi:trimeric autotransporter adhesin